MKLVLDTNVLLSAILVPGSCRELLKGRALAHIWFSSPGLLAELAEKLAGKLALDPERTPLYLVYRQRAHLVTPAPLPAPVSRDPDDDLVLATALAAEADVIITGDKDLLVLDAYAGIRIRSPRQFSDTPLA
ncbi:MAG TPA: putative toxin-antitoxin system toxin component, PIN family [Opitutaceae bacterium]